MESEKADKSPTPEKSAKQVPNGSPKNDLEFSIDSVGWLFVKRYYSTYTSSMNSVYTFYDKNAQLLHDEFPISSVSSEKVAKTVHLARGSEAIKAHYRKQSQKSEKCKIIVESANFQESLEGSILVVVCGLWKHGSSNLWQFLQTFVLSAKGKTVFDVFNDNLRFFDLSEDYVEKTVVVDHVEPQAVPMNAAVKIELTVTTGEPISTVEGDSRATAKDRRPVDEAPVVSQGKTETDIAQQMSRAQTYGDETSKPAESIVETQKAIGSLQKQTWAHLAAIQPKIPSKIASVPVSTVVKTTSPPVISSISPSHQIAANGTKFKKEEWYPIYIKHVEVEDEVLRAELVKQFGDLKFFKKNGKAALCDFKNKADQQKALDAKEVIVKGNVILLEPRVHKPFNLKQEKKEKKPIRKGLKK